MRIEIVDTGQILDVEPEIVLELVLHTNVRVLQDGYDKKVEVDVQGNRIIKLTCTDSVGIID